MFADDARVDIAWVDSEMLAEHVFEACGVEHRARPDDAVRRQP